MTVQENRSNNYSLEKITIEEFRDLYMQNIKGSFFKNDAIKKYYLIEGIVCSEVSSNSQGTSFKIQNEDGSTLNVYLPKRKNKPNSLEPGNRVQLHGMFNLYDSSSVNMLDFIEFKASKVLDTSISETKKETVPDKSDDTGYPDKVKKTLNLKGLDFFRIMVITSNENDTINQINNYLYEVNFFQTFAHYIDGYTAEEIADTIKSLDRNSYYDAIIITNIGPNEIGLFNEAPVLDALHQCDTLTIAAMGNTLANKLADITEDGPVSTAKMLLYEYRNVMLKESADTANKESTSTAYNNILSEKEELEKKISLLLNDKESLLTKTKSQKKMMTFFAILTIIAIIISIVK